MTLEEYKQNSKNQLKKTQEKYDSYKTSFLDKIKNIESFGDLIKKIKNKIRFFKTNTSFIINNWLVSLFYGKDIETYFFYQTSSEDVEQIKKVLDSSKQLKMLDMPTKGKATTYSYASDDDSEKELFELMNKEQTWFEIKRNPVFDNFLTKIKPIIRSYLKSPFAIVNLNAWKTKPNMKVLRDEEGNVRGPNRLHQDGMPAGHYKCLVYLKPLDSLSGAVQIEDKVFENKKPGSALFFNPNTFHQSIPGNSEHRYVFEITFMRTVFEVDMLKNYPGTPDSIHLLKAYQAYI